MIIKPYSQALAVVSTSIDPVPDLDDHRLDVRAARTVGGLYIAREDDDDDNDLSLLNAEALDQAQPVALAAAVKRGELRLDLDAPYPERVASGVVVLGVAMRPTQPLFPSARAERLIR